MRDKNSLVGLSIAFIFVALVWGALANGIPGFTSPDQNLVASSDVTVQQTAPGVNNDISEGYLPGYAWVDQTGNDIYIAEDTTDAAAVWIDVSASASGTVDAEEDNAVVQAASTAFDFGLGFNVVAEGTEADITLDYTEDPVILTGAEVTGTLDISDHTNLVGGTGITLTGDTLSADLGTDIDLTSEVTGTLPAGNGGTGQTAATADAVLVGNGSAFVARVVPDCNVAGSALNYEDTTDAWSCRSGLGGGGSGSVTTIEKGDIQVGDADIVTIDFGAGLAVTETPDTEVNITLDYTEDPVDLGTAEVTGTLGAANGGTGQTAATADGVLVGNGSAFVVRAVPDCDAAGNALNFDITTDGWSCRTGFLTTVDISDDTNLAAGTNITLTGDTLNVDDAFILNTGDTGTGAYDFGGATDFEIPNGAAESPNAAGEIAVDTTDDQLKYYGGAERVITYQYDKSVVIEDPADADNFLLFKAENAITITDIRCIVDPADAAESVVIDIQERNSTGDSPATVDATITCDNDGAEDDGTLTNGTIDAGDWVSIDIGTVTGTVTQVVTTITYTVDAA